MRWAFLLMDMTDNRTSMEPWSFPLVIWGGGMVGEKGLALDPGPQSHHLPKATLGSRARQ